MCLFLVFFCFVVLRNYYVYVFIHFSPKIKIENGLTAEDNKKVPVYEVKPIKKEPKSSETDSKNNLDVACCDSRKKTKENAHRSKTEKDQHRHREHRSRSRDNEHHHKPKESKKKEEKKNEEKTEPTASKVKLEEKSEPAVAKTKTEEKTEPTSAKTNGTVPKSRKRRNTLSPVSKPTKYAKHMNRNIKPPVVLVYADSVVAKDNVKHVLHDILNRQK